jgi:hypothetical protein
MKLFRKNTYLSNKLERVLYKGKQLDIPMPEPRTDEPGLRDIFNHDDLKSSLKIKMRKRGLFWSYDTTSIKTIGDDELISTTFTHGDLNELVGLLYLFPLTKLKSEWRKTFVKETHLKQEGEFVSLFLFNEKVKL